MRGGEVLVTIKPWNGKNLSTTKTYMRGRTKMGNRLVEKRTISSFTRQVKAE